MRDYIGAASEWRINAMEESEYQFMLLAIEEARKSTPEDERTHPMIGVVVVKNNEVLAVAHRGEAPGDHGEFTALEKKLKDDLIAGSTIYVTLEPCSNRNPPKIPCAKRLVERKVDRVVIGMVDPDRRIHGDGVDILEDAGIKVEYFPKELADQVKELNRDFIRSKRAGQKSESLADPSLVARYSERPLDEWYREVDNIFGDKNSRRTPTDIFTHLIEVVGGLSIIVSEKTEPLLLPESFVPKAIVWWMALCEKAYVSSVAEMVWTKFPYLCPYCQCCPHDADLCAERRSRSSVPDWKMLKQLGADNRGRRPERLGAWQRMFASIYPVHDAERYGWTFARLTEELGELAEAVRVFDKFHGYFCNEAADVFAWLMHVQNLIDRSNGVPTASRGDRLEINFSSAYPDRCLICVPGKPCSCPEVIEDTMIRIAQELPAGPDLFDFGRARTK